MSETSEESVENIIKRMEFLVSNKRREKEALQVRSQQLEEEIGRLQAGLAGLKGNPINPAKPAKAKKWSSERRAKYGAAKAAQSEQPATAAANEEGGQPHALDHL